MLRPRQNLILLLQANSLSPATLSLQAESFKPSAIVVGQFLHSQHNCGHINSTNICQDCITSSLLLLGLSTSWAVKVNLYTKTLAGAQQRPMSRPALSVTSTIVTTGSREHIPMQEMISMVTCPQGSISTHQLTHNVLLDPQTPPWSF